MTESVNIAYIEETENYIEQNKENMKIEIYQFIKQVCIDEKKYHLLLQQWGKEKGVMKVSEPKEIKD